MIFKDQNNLVSNLRWAYNTMKHLQFLRIYLQVLFTNYEPLPILLKSTSSEGEVRFFELLKKHPKDSLNPNSLAASGIDLKVLTTPSGEVDFKFTDVGFLPAILLRLRN